MPRPDNHYRPEENGFSRSPCFLAAMCFELGVRQKSFLLVLFWRWQWGPTGDVDAYPPPRAHAPSPPPRAEATPTRNKGHIAILLMTTCSKTDRGDLKGPHRRLLQTIIQTSHLITLQTTQLGVGNVSFFCCSRNRFIFILFPHDVNLTVTVWSISTTVQPQKTDVIIIIIISFI